MRLPRVRIDLFEFLYLAVAIATFEHTAWASAYLFQGDLRLGAATEEQVLWFVRGALVAIAVDIGMFVTSRFIKQSRNWQNSLVLAITFAVAALVSFYAQVMYIAVHTPTVTMSPGVADYWKPLLQALTDARVILLPIALPILATIFTLARLTHGRVEEAKQAMRDVTRVNLHVKPPVKVEPPQVRVEQPDVPKLEDTKAKRKQLPAGGRSTADLQALYSGLLRAPRTSEELVQGAERLEVEGAWLDLRKLTWSDTTLERSYGPYKDWDNLRSSVYQKMKQQGTRTAGDKVE